VTVDEPSISSLRPVPNQAPKPSGELVEVGAVRPIPVSSAKPHVVIPADFNDAQLVGDRFKNSQPVIINLQGADLDLARRVIDFASGLCYGLGGQMERVASQVYLLTPNDVEVSDEDRRRITERGLGRR
jgi:cell division inhibitor SepF